MKKKQHNILSPDGITIRQEHFPSKKLALLFYAEWKKGYEAQGYYSSNRGRISLSELDDKCEHVTF